jgi:hypothetical protein
LDELAVLPLGIMRAVKLVPPQIMAEHRAAAMTAVRKPTSRVAAAMIIATWIAVTGLLALAFWAGWISN